MMEISNEEINMSQVDTSEPHATPAPTRATLAPMRSILVESGYIKTLSLLVGCLKGQVVENHGPATDAWLRRMEAVENFLLVEKIIDPQGLR